MSDGDRMSAGIASLAAHARAQAERERLDAERAAARPAPLSITARAGRGDRALAQVVKCPACLAAVGQQCHIRARSQKPIAFHPSRLDAARAVVETAPTDPTGTNS